MHGEELDPRGARRRVAIGNMRNGNNDSASLSYSRICGLLQAGDSVDPVRKECPKTVTGWGRQVVGR